MSEVATPPKKKYKSKKAGSIGKKGGLGLADPKKALFVALYTDPTSPTFSNATQSGLKAGYSIEYSKRILTHLTPDLKEKLRGIVHNTLLAKAETNLNEMLELPSKTPAIGAFGPIFEKDQEGKKVPVMSHNPGLIKIKADVTKFVAERLGKKFYSEAKDDDPNRGSITNNFIQINIHEPGKSSGHTSQPEAVRSVESPPRSED